MRASRALCEQYKREVLAAPCVELPLRSIMHDGQVGMQGEKAMSCIFSSLAISGASCVEPGLSSGK